MNSMSYRINKPLDLLAKLSLETGDFGSMVDVLA
jgi:hypothetical protein